LPSLAYLLSFRFADSNGIGTAVKRSSPKKWIGSVRDKSFAHLTTIASHRMHLIGIDKVGSAKRCAVELAIAA
jgi:hypothetical protein